MASLDHENIVKVYDISQDDDGPFIVAECVGGRDLGAMLSRETRRGGSASEVYASEGRSPSSCEGLSYAHQRGA